jgi:hypothetical protein
MSYLFSRLLDIELVYYSKFCFYPVSEWFNFMGVSHIYRIGSRSLFWADFHDGANIHPCIWPVLIVRWSEGSISTFCDLLVLLIWTST